MTEKIMKINDTILIKDCNLFISEAEGNVCVMVEVDGKYWGFSKHKYTINNIMIDFEKADIIPIETTEESSCSA